MLSEEIFEEHLKWQYWIQKYWPLFASLSLLGSQFCSSLSVVWASWYFVFLVADQNICNIANLSEYMRVAHVPPLEILIEFIYYFCSHQLWFSLPVSVKVWCGPPQSPFNSESLSPLNLPPNPSAGMYKVSWLIREIW